MRTPVTKEECEQVIYQQRNKLFFRILDNFPAEEVEKLRRALAKSGKEQWLHWMFDNRQLIVDFLRNMPDRCSLPLDYSKNALLYHAVMYYFRRALFLLELLDKSSLIQIDDQDLDEFYRAVADVAETLAQLDYVQPICSWPFPAPNPFSPQEQE